MLAFVFERTENEADDHNERETKNESETDYQNDGKIQDEKLHGGNKKKEKKN